MKSETGQPRFIVFDCETTGLNPRKDRMISIGAVSVSDGQIQLDDIFDAVVQTAHATPATVVHGITLRESAAGVDEVSVIREFLDYARDAVLVGHHVGFDRELVQVAAERHGFPVPDWPALDTMRLAIGLEEAGVLGEPPIERFELDDLCRRFDVEMHDRHTAAGDAYLTAQVFLRLWRIAKKAGLDLMHFRELPTETDS